MNGNGLKTQADGSAQQAPVAAVNAKPPSLFLEELKRVWIELRGAQGTPARTAVAVAIGLFVGSQPIFGFHTFIVLGLCIWLRLDAALSWVASNISNPFFAPFLLTAEVQVGGMLLTGEPLMFSPELARDIGVSGFLGYAFVGALFVGLGLAALGSTIVFSGLLIKQRWAPSGPRAVYRLPQNAPAWWRAVEAIAARFCCDDLDTPDGVDTPAERARFHYVRIKLLRDPVMKMVADQGIERSLGEVLDIGTGRGQLPLLLLALDRADTVRGFDWDADKVEAAARAAARTPALAATFSVADATDAALADADSVLLIDVLHYLNDGEQDALIDRAAAAVRSGGRLLIREADTERGWRSYVTLLEEKVFTALRFNRGPRVRFRAVRLIVERLEQRGFDVTILPAWSGTPFSNVLVVAERREGDAG
jgi:uncharacterized protein (DUF2062 family)/SAM-dependent methyltransferase